MKQALVTLFLLLCIVQIKADQLCFITLEQAKEATLFLRKQKTILQWNACSEGFNPKRIITITEVYWEATGDKDYYKVVVIGKDSKGKKVETVLDLAYTNYKKENKAYCVGQALGYKCDPCTNPFDWKETSDTKSGKSTQLDSIPVKQGDW